MFLNIPNVEFNCPHCKKEYNDMDEKYLNRLNRNGSCFTTIKCSCGNKFSMTYNIQGDAVSFI